MTEITANTDTGDRARVRLVPFLIALILSPIITALLTFWVYLIPVFAVIFGAPSYLLFGTPVLWLCVKRYGAHPGVTAMFAFATNLMSFFPVLLYCHFALREPQMAIFIVGFGAIFAPLWGFAFGVLYNCMVSQPKVPGDV